MLCVPFLLCFIYSVTGACEVNQGWVHPEYNDRCADYDPGTENAQYACGDELVVKNCCPSCGSSSSSSPSSLSSAPSSSSSCTINIEWKHSEYGDACDDYQPTGNSYEYACDAEAAANCCTCEGSATAGEATAGDNTGCTVNNDWTHSEHSDKCVDYQVGGASSDYACDPEAAENCCTCPEVAAAASAVAIVADTGSCTASSTWKHSEYGDTCSDYLPGGAAADYACDPEPTENCCTCPQQTSVENTASSSEASISTSDGNGPFPDKGDDIVEEYIANDRFEHKKHLQGGFVVYWSLNTKDKTVKIALLSPKGKDNKWISIGFSPLGGMAKSYAIVGWFDKGQGVVKDYYMENQAASGIEEGQYQEMYNEKIVKINGYVALVYERPLKPQDSYEIDPFGESTVIIYGYGSVAPSCKPLGWCVHSPKARWTADIILAAPAGMSVYQANLQARTEPCHGPARLDCMYGLSCIHSKNLDQFNPDYTKYGECLTPADLGAEEEDPDEFSWDTTQKVFENNGGFQYNMTLFRSYELLWSINDDVVSMAIVSLRESQASRWIGFGISPTGEMKGTDAVIGWLDGDNVHVGDYFLSAQVNSAVKETNKQDLRNLRIISKNGQTALMFERPLIPPKSTFIVEGPLSIIIATGPTPAPGSKLISYHNSRFSQEIALIPGSEDLIELQRAGQFENCGGKGAVECRRNLQCMPMMELMNMARRMGMMKKKGGKEGAVGGFGTPSASNATDYGMDTKGSDQESVVPTPVPPTPLPQRNNWGGGGSSNSGGNSTSGSRWGGSRSNVWASVDWTGGMCFSDEIAGRMDQANLDPSKIDKGVKEGEYEKKKVLNRGFELYWTVEGDMIKMALVVNARGQWVGVGFSPGGTMVGSYSVVGWDDQSGENSKVKEYLLFGKLPWMLTYSSKLKITDSSVENTGTSIVIRFTRPLNPADGPPIHPNGEPKKNYIIYARGAMPKKDSDFFRVHSYRDMAEVDFF